jgi:hypothetical protein
MVIFNILFDPFKTQNKNTFCNKFAILGPSAVFVCPISILFAPKTAFSEKICIIFLAHRKLARFYLILW